MTQDQIIELARKAGFHNFYWTQDYHMGIVQRFAAFVAAHERKACALVCDEQEQRSIASVVNAKRSRDRDIYGSAAQTSGWNAAAIRARGDKP